MESARVAAAQKAAADQAAAQRVEAARLAAARAALPADQALAAPALGAAPAAFAGAPLGAGLLTSPYDPALLLAAPAGSPLRSLAASDPASLVTTSSQVQAMALDGLPDGVGLPATLGALVLAALGAFAVRHRMISRGGNAATETEE